MKNVFRFLCILTTTLSTAHRCLYHYLIYRCLLLTNLSPALSPLHRLTCYTDAMSAWVQFVVHFRCCIQELNSGLKRSAARCSGNFLCLFTATCLLHNHWCVFFLHPYDGCSGGSIGSILIWSKWAQVQGEFLIFFPHCIVTETGLCSAPVCHGRVASCGMLTTVL